MQSLQLTHTSKYFQHFCRNTTDNEEYEIKHAMQQLDTSFNSTKTTHTVCTGNTGCAA